MKLVIRLGYIYVLLFCVSALSQDYERIDATIVLYPSNCENPEEISKFITRDFTTEEEKVRAIYSWIIQNVSYDPEEYKKFNYKFKNYRERNQKEEISRKNIINRTLQKGVAVCEGYAMLFERLCELQGISNYLVRGDIKTNFNDIGREFNTVHMWNVAVIDGTPYLFDPTWGAGKYHQKFIKDPSYFYYKTPPELFIKTHYPDIFEDAFISEEVSRQVFSQMPLIIDQQLELKDLETPNKGIIYTEMYFDEIQFSIRNATPNKVSYSYGNKILPVEKLEHNKNQLSFSIPIELGVNTLLIYFDEAPALGYLIK